MAARMLGLYVPSWPSYIKTPSNAIFLQRFDEATSWYNVELVEIFRPAKTVPNMNAEYILAFFLL
jgi:hypothetical protein